MLTTVLVFILLITLPGTLYLAIITLAGVLAFRAKKQNANGVMRKLERMAVVIPAHDEEAVIARTIESINACSKTMSFCEIVVIADNCSDKTANIAQSLGCQVLIRNDANNKGKGYALDFAFGCLSEEGFELYIIVDADVELDGNFLLQFENSYNQGHNIIQSLNLIKPDANNLYADITNLGFRAMNYFRPMARQYMKLSCGIFGTGFALSHHTLQEVSYSTSSIAEDVEYHTLLVEKGLKAHFTDATGLVSNMPAIGEAAAQQRARWEGGRINLARSSALRLLKRLRVTDLGIVEPLLELALLPLAYHTTLLIILFYLSSNSLLIYAVFSITVLILHVFCVITFTGNGVRDLKVLFKVPVYILWKIRILWTTLAHAKSNSDWVRTPRK